MLLSFRLFFFSSRRRHTRLQGDWSSDVCSSDLTRPSAPRARTIFAFVASSAISPAAISIRLPFTAETVPLTVPAPFGRIRSEERRVGKERELWWRAVEEKMIIADRNHCAA